jgi:hypothetical protein
MEALVTATQGPRERRAPAAAAIGDCPCPKCVAIGRQEIQDGSSYIPWGSVNKSVHGADLRVPASSKYSPLTPRAEMPVGRSQSHADGCLECQREAQRLNDGGVRWVSWSAVRQAVHHGVEYSPAPDRAPKPEPKPAYRIAGLPYKFGFDQLVGASAGLTLSLPMISVFSMSPLPGMVLATVLTTLGVNVPVLIRKSRDTEKRNSQTPAAPKSSRKARLASANQDRQVVLLAWARYETDVALQIDYPAMTDVRKPETAALAKALRAAEIASRHAGESIDSLIRYEGAVLDLEGAFKAAETAAKLDHENPLTTDQQALAHTLLAIAVDPAGNIHERRQAHQRLLKLLDGVIVLSDQARLALEASTARREVQQ